MDRSSLLKQKKSEQGNGTEIRKKLEGQELNKFLAVKRHNCNNFLEDEVSVLL